MTNVLVYVDGSHAADGALRYAAGSVSQAKVLILHVVTSARAGALGNGERVLARSRSLYLSLAGSGAEVDTRIEVGSPVACIAAVAEETNADAIVMGSHDLGAFPRAQALGSAAEGMVSMTDRPVILIFPDGTGVVPAAERQGM